MVRNQRWAGPASIQECQNSGTVKSRSIIGGFTRVIPSRNARVCASGTIATRSEAREQRIGLVAMGLGATALAIVPESTGAVGHTLSLMLPTSGFATIQAANNSASMGATAVRRHACGNPH